MRITFLSPFASLAGGIRVKAIYATKLQERGHDVHVISLAEQVPTRSARLRAAVGLTKLKPRKESTPLLEALGDKHVILNHRGPITADEVPDGDVVVATFWETAAWVAALPPSKGRKFYLLQDYETFKKGKSEQVSATYDLPLQKIAVSDYIAKMLSEHHGIHDVPVVPNSVDTHQFQTGPRTKNDDLTIGFLYTGKPRKNVEMAIEIAKQAKSKIPGLRVKAFGSIAPIEKLPLPNWVEYRRAPPQEDIARIYGACDVWLFTSHHEGFGLPILEAMACGTPVLATRAGAAPQIVDGSNGALLETEASVFVDALVEYEGMTDDAWLRQSDAARKTAQSYSWDAATDTLLACLTEPVAA